MLCCDVASVSHLSTDGEVRVRISFGDELFCFVYRGQKAVPETTVPYMKPCPISNKRNTIETRSSLKSSIFRDITRCSPMKVNLRFGGTCHLHFQGRRICRARNPRESRWKAELCFDPEDGSDMFLRNVS
jgi:hypothetical protein